ncbi:MAG: trypsin-like peptidase domain-containing protein [Variibacter sp.]|nr:trypsin-like peptidase domain-containing protein [Variibacter sp.]
MPVIRHRSGPLAGREQSLDPQIQRITFGRDPSACDVVYPPDLTLVARRHFALVRKPSGEWMFEDFGDPFVAVNGRPAETDERINSGAVIELGRKGGPSFEVLFEGKGLDTALPVTEVQQKVMGSRAAAARARTFALAGIGVAVLAAVVAGTLFFLTGNEGKRLEQAVANLQKAQEQAAAESIGAQARDKVISTAYLVLKRFASGQETGQGTAFPIGPDLFATNAHVADLSKTLGPGDKLLVRGPGVGGKTYEVIETKNHPGYDAFNKFLAEDPLFVVAARDCPTCFPSMLKGSLSYDVALMKVAPGSNVSPVLEIAGQEELNALRPGQPLGIAGYPLENIQGREVQVLGATPNFRTGSISAMTDMFNLPGEPEERRLIHHNIPVTGGNSGSAVVGASGKLVALINSINPIATAGGGRMPNAAIINYAQRADLLLDLISGKAEAKMDAERAYWAKQTAAFKRGFDVIVPQLVQEGAPPNAGAATQLSQGKFTLVKADRYETKDKDGKTVARRQRIHPVTAKANQPGMFIAYAQDREPVQIYIVQDGKIVAQHESNVWFAAVKYPALPADTKADVYVVSGDNDVNYTLLQYVWDAPRS